MNKITKQGDKVDISANSKEIAGILSEINQLPEVREKMVQAIKQRVEAGSYTVDPNKVAEKILKETEGFELPSSTRM
jgi:negative regulator of flagellin synthesis FlgM